MTRVPADPDPPPGADRDPALLERALQAVHATLADLLAAADDQRAAIAAGDREQLERVTRHQERLSARLERAERQRLALLDGRSLPDVVASLPAADAERVSGLVRAIGQAVVSLRERQAATSALLERSIDLAAQTIHYLQRLVTSQAQAYTARGLAAPTQSLLVDSRA